MAKQEGFNLKIKVEGTAYRAKRVEFDDSCTDLEVGDSEDGVFEAHTGGRAVGKLTVENATFDPADNPHDTPYNIEARAHIAVEIYWAGIAEGEFDDLPDVLVTSIRKAGDVAGLIPVSFTGVTSGEYTLFGM